VYSAYTILEGAIEPKAIGETAKKLGFPAISICDRNGLYGVMPFQDSAKSFGVQPIIGALLGVRRPTSDGKFIRDVLYRDQFRCGEQSEKHPCFIGIAQDTEKV
jgi:DNA polymerase III alpha subunit